ncbi:MAG: glycosyltransferase [Saprospiraceae bacterium]|nr:glycosyltransferase [Saprospiraceae bacterium]
MFIIKFKACRSATISVSFTSKKHFVSIENADIGVVLINWNHAAETAQCLDMLRSWARLRCQIVIVDNASADSDRMMLKDLNATIIQNESNKGYGHALNQGLHHLFSGSPELALVMNTDVTIREQDLIQMIWTIKSHREIGLLGPVLEEKSDQGSRFSLGGLDIAREVDTRHWTPALEALPPSSPTDAIYVPGTLFLIAKAAFAKTGDLSTHYFFSGEIADYCKQLQSQGYRCAIDHQAMAHHLRTERPGGVRDHLYIYYTLRNRFLYIERHGPSAQRMRWMWHGLRQYLGAIVRGRLQRARALRLALIHGLQHTFGNQNHLFLRR